MARISSLFLCNGWAYARQSSLGATTKPFCEELGGQCVVLGSLWRVWPLCGCEQHGITITNHHSHARTTAPAAHPPSSAPPSSARVLLARYLAPALHIPSSFPNMRTTVATLTAFFAVGVFGQTPLMPSTFPGDVSSTSSSSSSSSSATSSLSLNASSSQTSSSVPPFPSLDP